MLLKHSTFLALIPMVSDSEQSVLEASACPWITFHLLHPNFRTFPSSSDSASMRASQCFDICPEPFHSQMQGAGSGPDRKHVVVAVQKQIDPYIYPETKPMVAELSRATGPAFLKLNALVRKASFQVLPCSLYGAC